MPDPLDAAFAALGNNQAAPLLAPAARHSTATRPISRRCGVLADDHGESFWGANLYNLWLAALRALSTVAAGQTASARRSPARRPGGGGC